MYDLHPQALTVYETLHYAAKLRLPRDMSAEAKKQRVESVIKALGLEACQHTPIGGYFRKGISGGERKRTSVGHELVINPSVLMLDEPTRWVVFCLLPLCFSLWPWIMRSYRAIS